MLVLNKEQKQLLVNKIKFTVNFMMTTGAPIGELFNIRVFDADSTEVLCCELTFKKSNSIFMRMKSLSNEHDEYDIRFGVQEEGETEGLRYMDETTIRFFVSEESNDNLDFMETIREIFKQVTEWDKGKQYEKLNNAINDLLNY